MKLSRNWSSCIFSCFVVITYKLPGNKSRGLGVNTVDLKLLTGNFVMTVLLNILSVTLLLQSDAATSLTKGKNKNLVKQKRKQPSHSSERKIQLRLSEKSCK